MSISENELKYKEEILILINEFIKISKKPDTNFLEDGMLKTLGLNDTNLSKESIECFQKMYTDDLVTADQIIELLKK